MEKKIQCSKVVGRDFSCPCAACVREDHSNLFDVEKNYLLRRAREELVGRSMQPYHTANYSQYSCHRPPFAVSCEQRRDYAPLTMSNYGLFDHDTLNKDNAYIVIGGDVRRLIKKEESNFAKDILDPDAEIIVRSKKRVRKRCERNSLSSSDSWEVDENCRHGSTSRSHKFYSRFRGHGQTSEYFRRKVSVGSSSSSDSSDETKNTVLPLVGVVVGDRIHSSKNHPLVKRSVSFTRRKYYPHHVKSEFCTLEEGDYADSYKTSSETRNKGCQTDLAETVSNKAVMTPNASPVTQGQHFTQNGNERDISLQNNELEEAMKLKKLEKEKSEEELAQIRENLEKARAERDAELLKIKQEVLEAKNEAEKRRKEREAAEKELKKSLREKEREEKRLQEEAEEMKRKMKENELELQRDILRHKREAERAAEEAKQKQLDHEEELARLQADLENKRKQREKEELAATTASEKRREEEEKSHRKRMEEQQRALEDEARRQEEERLYRLEQEKRRRMEEDQWKKEQEKKRDEEETRRAAQRRLDEELEKKRRDEERARQEELWIEEQQRRQEEEDLWREEQERKRNKELQREEEREKERQAERKREEERRREEDRKREDDRRQEEQRAEDARNEEALRQAQHEREMQDLEKMKQLELEEKRQQELEEKRQQEEDERQSLIESTASPRLERKRKTKGNVRHSGIIPQQLLVEEKGKIRLIGDPHIEEMEKRMRQRRVSEKRRGSASASEGRISRSESPRSHSISRMRPSIRTPYNDSSSGLDLMLDGEKLALSSGKSSPRQSFNEKPFTSPLLPEASP